MSSTVGESVQYGLDTLAGDVATVRRTLGRVSRPAILVGHSYGGSVITAAGTDDRVVALVYIAALAPDADETSQSQQEKFPVTDVFAHVEVADGRVWMLSDGVEWPWPTPSDTPRHDRGSAARITEARIWISARSPRQSFARAGNSPQAFGASPGACGCYEIYAHASSLT
jgi:pimeloyl-ACP methyl ester carboxylesterase